VVFKKNGEIRVVFDFRKVNEATENQSYTMKFQDEMMTRVAGHKFVSLVDFLHGYHHIPMADKDKEKTAFSVPGPRGGQYQWKVMPFGLKNAPATFQQFMDDVFHKQLGQFAVVYVDDLAVYSNSEDEYLKHLEEIFKTMRQNQIYARREKCFFMQKKIPFLGHYVSEAGIETDPKKVETIKNWPQIDSVKKLRAFLGLAGYYHKFIKGYAQIALPLSNLLKSDVPFQWTQNQEEAKKALSEAITQSPILQKPDFTQPMTLTTDASDKALGAVLSQNDRPIAFLSKTFSQTECNWPIYEKEMYAVIYTLHKWEHWLLGVDLTIVTDNSALSHIQNQPKLVAKQARWIQFLEQFNYKMVHRPGAENKVADGISRQDIYGITIVDNQQWLERIRNLTKKIEKPTKIEESNGLLYKNN
jgi:hypothetical protein